MPPLSDDPTDPTPDPFFDAAIFHIENGAFEDAAAQLAEGETYRKGSLGLDAEAAAELGRHLATRGLALVDEDTHWLIAAAEPPRPIVQRGAECVCGHRAGDHDDRGVCTYRYFAGHTCPCASYTPAPDPKPKDPR